MEKKLIVDKLSISFRTISGTLKAVRSVSFQLCKGETLAIVGESGSGKSVTARAIMGILAGNAQVEGGQILYEGENLLEITEHEYHEIRGKKIGMVYQDPMSSLNPIMRIGKQITESMILNGNHLEKQIEALYKKERLDYLKARRDVRRLKENMRINRKEKKPHEDMKRELARLRSGLPGLKAQMRQSKKQARAQVMKTYKDKKAEKLERIKALKRNDQGFEKKALKVRLAQEKEALKRLKRVTRLEAKERAIEIMREVGIPEPEKRFKQYPFQFSGGMRQRIVIAVVLAGDPDLLICDEPTTALDVTIQSQILELIKKLKKERGLTVIFITHDLGVVANTADRIAVMYAGKIQEIGTSEEVFYDPRHPYTWALLGSMPDLTSKEALLTIAGSPPDMRFPPIGDAFAPRSDYAMKIDFELEPPMFKISNTHYAATWLLHKDSQTVMKPPLLDERIKRMKELTKELLESEEELKDI